MTNGGICNIFTVLNQKRTPMCHQISSFLTTMLEPVFSPVKFSFRDAMSVFVWACVLVSTAYSDSRAGLPDMYL